jgi:hypothetical protein
MKSLRYLPVLVVLFMTTSVPGAVANGTKAVKVTNNTTYTMSELYASSSDSSDWDTSNNLLAGQTVTPGQSTTITIADGLSACTYDLMAILYGATQHAYQYKVDACDDDGGRWTVHQ